MHRKTLMTTSRDEKRGSILTGVPLYKLKSCAEVESPLASAPRKTLFYGEKMKFKFVVLFIALAVSCSAVAPAQEKQIDWGSV
jgi:hypothetical protein